MTRIACLIEYLDEAQKSGRAAAQRGEPALPDPRTEDCEGQHADYYLANQYHENWMIGWKKGCAGLKNVTPPS